MICGNQGNEQCRVLRYLRQTFIRLHRKIDAKGVGIST